MSKLFSFIIIAILSISGLVGFSMTARAESGCCVITQSDGAMMYQDTASEEACDDMEGIYAVTQFYPGQKARANGCFADDDETGSSTPKISNPLDNPKLSVSIPGFGGFTKAECTETSCNASWIGQYIAALYRYGIGTIGILAVVVIMIAGVMWLTSAGNSHRVDEAKKLIIGSIAGLCLAFTSYLILTLVNPALTSLSPISLTYIKHEDLDAPDTSAPIVNAGSGGVIAGVAFCPGSGGPDAVVKIAQSLQGKVTYRYGGKGGPPPYTPDPKRHQCDGKPCETFCPEGQVCLDCSGFINHVLTCAGLPAPGGGTADIFGSSKAERVTTIDDTHVNGKSLRPGDLLGWPKVGNANNGHVLVYVGNGQVAESHGGSGWQGNAMRISPVTSHSKIKYVRRISN